MQATSRGPITRLKRTSTLARLDVRATYAFLRAAPHLRDGHVPRRLLDPDWTPASRGLDWLATLKRRIERDPARGLAELEPQHDGYRRLREALSRYRAKTAPIARLYSSSTNRASRVSRAARACWQAASVGKSFEESIRSNVSAAALSG